MMRTVKTFTNKNGKLTWAVLKDEKTNQFVFRNFQKTMYSATREQLANGWWEGTVPKYAREAALQENA